MNNSTAQGTEFPVIIVSTLFTVPYHTNIQFSQLLHNSCSLFF